MLLIEVKRGKIYIEANDREEILRLFPYLIEAYEKLDQKKKLQYTWFEDLKK